MILLISCTPIKNKIQKKCASLVPQLVKNLPVIRETWVWSLVWEDLLEKGVLPTPVFWLGEFHGLYRPWGPKESDMSEWLENFHHFPPAPFLWLMSLQDTHSDRGVAARHSVFTAMPLLMFLWRIQLAWWAGGARQEAVCLALLRAACGTTAALDTCGRGAWLCAAVRRPWIWVPRGLHCI